MCGIFVSAVKCDSESKSCDVKQETRNRLLRRGPDCYCESLVEVNAQWKLLFAGSVLWMQGEFPTNQPCVDANSNILLWNGDIFDGPLVPTEKNSDTACLLQSLAESGNVLETLAAVRGPYAVVYWHAAMQRLWFGRDRLGRHSLLWHLEDNGNLKLISVGGKGSEYSEVPTIGIFMVDFSNSGTNVITLHPWSDVINASSMIQNATKQITIATTRIQSPVVLSQRFPQIEPSEEFLEIMNQFDGSSLAVDVFQQLLCYSEVRTRVEELILRLRQSVKFRCKIQPGVCKKCLTLSKRMNSESEMWVCYENDTNLKQKINYCKHPKVGILFSGGLDSTILAALTHGFVPLDEPIDLINVAFECGQKTVNKSRKNRPSVQVVTKKNFCAPDRETGIQSSEELRTIFPMRQWNFVQIDVSKEELNEKRNERIADLIHPLNTVLDDSLGCALWFASRQQGTLLEEAYTSPARVLLLGMGADEQLGGYARHRNLLRSAGWLALTNELQLEVARIAYRNLGRDDRIVSDHGCQGRFPFLDEAFVSYLSSLPAWARCYPIKAFPPGVGDKLLLRLAAWSIGLHQVATFPKRAFQFGSRIANKKDKGSDVSSHLVE